MYGVVFGESMRILKRAVQTIDQQRRSHSDSAGIVCPMVCASKEFSWGTLSLSIHPPRVATELPPGAIHVELFPG